MQRKIELIVGSSYRVGSKVYKSGMAYLVPVETARNLLKAKTYGGKPYFRLVPEALPQDDLLDDEPEQESEPEVAKELSDDDYEEFFEDDVQASAAV